MSRFFELFRVHPLCTSFGGVVPCSISLSTPELTYEITESNYPGSVLVSSLFYRFRGPSLLTYIYFIVLFLVLSSLPTVSPHTTIQYQ